MKNASNNNNNNYDIDHALNTILNDDRVIIVVAGVVCVCRVFFFSLSLFIYFF